MQGLLQIGINVNALSFSDLSNSLEWIGCISFTDTRKLLLAPIWTDWDRLVLTFFAIFSFLALMHSRAMAVKV